MHRSEKKTAQERCAAKSKSNQTWKTTHGKSYHEDTHIGHVVDDSLDEGLAHCYLFGAIDLGDRVELDGRKKKKKTNGWRVGLIPISLVPVR